MEEEKEKGLKRTEKVGNAGQGSKFWLDLYWESALKDCVHGEGTGQIEEASSSRMSSL